MLSVSKRESQLTDDDVAMVRAFEDALARAYGGNVTQAREAPILGAAWAPAVDVREEGAKLLLSLEIASGSVDPDSMSASYRDGVLTISFRRWAGQ